MLTDGVSNIEEACRRLKWNKGRLPENAAELVDFFSLASGDKMPALLAEHLDASVKLRLAVRHAIDAWESILNEIVADDKGA